MAALMEGLVTLADCPIGLFECMGELCLKTEYGNNEGRIDAYIVSSGEFFWGPSPQSIANQRACMVRSVSADRLAHSEPRPVAGEVLEALKLADALLRGANMNRALVERKVIAAITSLSSGHGISAGTLELLRAMLSGYDGEPSQAGEAFKIVDAALATHSPAPTEAGEVERARTIARHMVEACGELANSTKYDASDRALWGSAEADAQEIFDLLTSTQGGAEG